MPDDCPTTVKKEKHVNRTSGHEYREEAVLKETKAVVKAKATAKAKARPTKSILKNWPACPKKNDEIEEEVQLVSSESYGTCGIYSSPVRSYVEWLDPDTARWSTLFDSTSWNHDCQCQYLKDKLMEGCSREVITEVVAILKMIAKTASDRKGR